MHAWMGMLVFVRVCVFAHAYFRQQVIKGKIGCVGQCLGFGEDKSFGEKQNKWTIVQQ